MGSKNNKKSLIKILGAFAISLVCLFGLSACTWFTNDTSSSASGLDANGNLRVSGVSVSLTSPNSDGSVDETTGSFTWGLNYYIDAVRDKDDPLTVKPEYDQEYYTHFYNSYFKENANPAEDDNNLLSYLSTMKGQLSGTTAAAFNSASPMSMYVRYPSYSVSISGIVYEIRVNVKYENLVFDFNQNQMFKLKDGITIEDAFSFDYRIGGAGDWQTDYQMASAFMQDDKFYVRFNPMLDRGSTSRYIRVQSTISKQENIPNYMLIIT